VLFIGDAQFANWIANALMVEAVPTSELMAAFYTDARMSIVSSKRTFGWPEAQATPLRRALHEVGEKIESSWGALS
jgi:hypothetical protein